MKIFKFKLTIKVAQVWIDDGVTLVGIKERLREFIEEELNPDSMQGEYEVVIE